jgi:hypothetical protein
MSTPPLEKFQTICRRISLNLPPSAAWQWDAQRDHALVVFDREDLELILLPVSLEFDQQWDFATMGSLAPSVARFLDAGFGLMPGQTFFIAHPDGGQAPMLYATCWPWGDGANFSLRVGFISMADPTLPPERLRACLMEWLAIAPAQASVDAGPPDPQVRQPRFSG